MGSRSGTERCHSLFPWLVLGLCFVLCCDVTVTGRCCVDWQGVTGDVWPELTVDGLAGVMSAAGGCKPTL